MIGPLDSLYLTLVRALRVRGRASRADVVWWCVFASALYAVVPGAIALSHGAGPSSGVVYAGSAAAVLGLAVPTTTLLVRRLGEMGRGWYPAGVVASTMGLYAAVLAMRAVQAASEAVVWCVLVLFVLVPAAVLVLAVCCVMPPRARRGTR